jgi:CO/xanthine dehydrogenase FAD-binding subunit
MVKNYRPNNLKEALDWMAEHKLIPVAGGTDLMIRARNWQGASRAMKGDVIYIQHLEELKFIRETETAYHIGAGVTQAQFYQCDKLPDYAREVVGQMATPAIRNAATIGGNIANAASVADLLPLLYVVDAQIVLRSRDHQRMLPVQSFEIGKYKTARRPDELIFEVILPKLKIKRYLYRKMGQRRANILSKLSFLALEAEDGTRIAIGAVNDSVVRSRELEKRIDEGSSVKSVLDGYKSLLNGSDDKRSTKRYRERVAINLLMKWMEEK